MLDLARARDQLPHAARAAVQRVRPCRAHNHYFRIHNKTLEMPKITKNSRSREIRVPSKFTDQSSNRTRRGCVDISETVCHAEWPADKRIKRVSNPDWTGLEPSSQNQQFNPAGQYASYGYQPQYGAYPGPAVPQYGAWQPQPPDYRAWIIAAVVGGVLFSLLLGMPLGLIAQRNSRRVLSRWESGDVRRGGQGFPVGPVMGDRLHSLRCARPAPGHHPALPFRPADGLVLQRQAVTSLGVAA